MKNLTFKSLFLLLGLIAVVGVISSCSDDPEEITGCTDEDAINYNADATISDNSTCTYLDRYKFIGDYEGTLACEMALSAILDNDMLTFTIGATPGGEDNEVTISLTGAIPLSFGGTVSGDVLTISQELMGVPLTIAGMTVVVNMDIGGEITYDTSNDTVGGALTVMNIKTETGGTAAPNDSCDVTGTKL